MKLICKLEVESGNDAFSENPHQAMLDILDQIQEKLESEFHSNAVNMKVRDENGNGVGYFNFNVYDSI